MPTGTPTPSAGSRSFTASAVITELATLPALMSTRTRALIGPVLTSARLRLLTLRAPSFSVPVPEASSFAVEQVAWRCEDQSRTSASVHAITRREQEKKIRGEEDDPRRTEASSAGRPRKKTLGSGRHAARKRLEVQEVRGSGGPAARMRLPAAGGPAAH